MFERVLNDRFDVLQEESMATLDILQQRPELLLLITKTLVQAAVAAAAVAAVAAATHTAHAAGVAAGVAEEKARAAAALG